MSPTASAAPPSARRSSSVTATSSPRGPDGREEVREAEALHDPPRRHVLRLVDADDAARGRPSVKPNSTAAAPASVARPAPAPGRRQAPPHLDGRQDLGQEVRHGEARPPDHGPAGPVDQRLDPEAVAARSAPVTRSRNSAVSSFDMPAAAGTTRTTPRRGWRPARRGRRGRRGAGPAAAWSASGMPGSSTVRRRSAQREPGRVGQRGVTARPGGRRRRAGPAGTTARPGRPARPPTTSTQTSPVSPLVTCATNSQEAPRSRVPSTCTGSPGRSPAQRVVRRRSATCDGRRTPGTIAPFLPAREDGPPRHSPAVS